MEEEEANNDSSPRWALIAACGGERVAGWRRHLGPWPVPMSGCTMA